MRYLTVSMILVVLMLLITTGFLGAQDEFSPVQSYVVQKGDSAASIARKFYGKPVLGPKLWLANQNLVAHPKRLTVGDTIYIFSESTLNAREKNSVSLPLL